LKLAFNTAEISDNNIRVLLLAMAMLEINTLDINEHDTSKDGNTDGSANVSIFNLNMDMITLLGYKENTEFLNHPKNLSTIVGILHNAFETWGIDKTLNFIRGGHSGFNDGISGGCVDYRNTITTIYYANQSDLTFLYDSCRVNLYLAHA
jgi:hypothetical protein